MAESPDEKDTNDLVAFAMCLMACTMGATCQSGSFVERIFDEIQATVSGPGWKNLSTQRWTDARERAQQMLNAQHHH